MPATRPTTLQQRHEMVRLGQAGFTHQMIAEQLGVSRWTARKWRRRGRSGEPAALVSVLGRPATGPLAERPALMRYLALRWKRQHPTWGAAYVVQRLQTRPSLRPEDLPSPVSVWRYWRTFGDRLFPQRHAPEPKPPRAGVVHGVWQLDFNESLDVAGLGSVTVAQARDSVGRATVLHRVHPAESAEQRIVKLTTEQVQADCRIAFSQWGLPDAIQTDHASLFADDDLTPFPTRLKLWWLGLGIDHCLIPRHTPECNGSVERSHRTLNERTLVGQTFQEADQLQAQVDADWQELNTRCPSRARGCNGHPPLVAHPNLLVPRRTYFPEHEAQMFDLQRVDHYLAQFTWLRLVNSHGRLSLGRQRYGLGRAWAGLQVSIRFEPGERVFRFTALQPKKSTALPALTPIVRPALGLTVADLCGSITPYPMPPRQLCFPVSFFQPPAAPVEARLSETSPEARV